MALYTAKKALYIRLETTRFFLDKRLERIEKGQDVLAPGRRNRPSGVYVMAFFRIHCSNVEATLKDVTSLTSRALTTEELVNVRRSMEKHVIKTLKNKLLFLRNVEVWEEDDAHFFQASNLDEYVKDVELIVNNIDYKDMEIVGNWPITDGQQRLRPDE
jgi:hypothetical protein